MKIRSLSFKIVSVLIFGSLLSAPPGFAQKALELSISREVTPEQDALLASHGLNSIQIGDFRRLVSSAKGKVEVNFDKTHKIPDFLKAEISFPTEITQPEEQSYHYFDQFMALYRMKDPRTELKTVRVTQGRRGNHNIRFLQHYKGIKVVGAETIVHVHPGGKLWFVQGKYVPDIDLSTQPVVESASVLQTVQDDFVAKKGAGVQFTLSSPELAILNPWVFDRSLENKNILIWMVVLRETLTGREFTYSIDAQNGQILNIADSVKYIDSEIWDCHNTAHTTDELWYVDNVLNIPGGTPNPETANLNTFVTDYWNYLFNQFGVYSIDSATSPEGMQLVAHAYYLSGDCPNAWWEGSNNRAVFCQGEVLRDIVAHELTHGLVQHSGPDFQYENQQGALDESFADVFGEFIDCRAGNCTWLHGNSRDVSTPLNIYQQPDYIGDTVNWSNYHPFYSAPCDPSVPNDCNTANDYGGRHKNDGVPNRVAYLIVNGTGPSESHYNYRVEGIGITKAEQLYYGTLVDAGLTAAAEFVDVARVMDAVCWDLPGFDMNDCCQVRSAWASVGVAAACYPLGGVAFGTFWGFVPYFVVSDATVPAGEAMVFEPIVDIYFFPNTKITASGTLSVDGRLVGPSRLLSSKSNAGMKVWGQLRVKNGGQLKFPVTTYPNNDTHPHPITIRNSGRQTGSFIRIDEDFTISDLNVTLNINHTSVGFLTATLKSPAGTSITLFDPTASLTGANFTGTTFDDEAATAITAGVAPFTGSFRPQNSLSAFDGQNARGYWKLTVKDGGTGQQGGLQSWSLTFER